MSLPEGTVIPPPALRERLKHVVGPLVALAAFIGAVLLLYLELKDHSLSQIGSAIAAIPRERIVLAVGLTILNYTILSGYDGLAVLYLKRPLTPWKVMLGAFVGYAMSHNLTWMLGGTASRFRLYLAWGFSAVEVVKLFALIGLTFWTGFCFLAGMVFLLRPMPIPPEIHIPLSSTFWLGPILLGILALYLLGCAVGRRVSYRGWRIEFPPLHIALMQAVVAACDLLLQAAVAYVLMPVGYDITYWRFANTFLLAIAAAIISHVPGGAGVLEVVVLELVPHDDPAAIFGSLIAFRITFYLMPLIIAVALFVAHEWIAHRRSANASGTSDAKS
jgi:phosphatidylglycerol lysyltransferase